MQIKLITCVNFLKFFLSAYMLAAHKIEMMRHCWRVYHSIPSSVSSPIESSVPYCVCGRGDDGGEDCETGFSWFGDLSCEEKKKTKLE